MAVVRDDVHDLCSPWRQAAGAAAPGTPEGAQGCDKRRSANIYPLSTRSNLPAKSTEVRIDCA